MFRGTLVALLPVSLLAGCMPPAESGPLACGAATPMQIYQLYFGRGIKGGGMVSDQDWTAFRESTITPNLPSGYTILDASGGWAAAGTGKAVIDPTKVVIAAMPDQPASLVAIDRVRSGYQTRFNQDLVGMIVQPGCASF